MKQTAVEWLIEQFKDYDCTPASNNDEYVIVMPQWIFNAKRDEAKQMEKQQIMDAHIDRMDCTSKEEMRNILGNQYYNETYGGGNTTSLELLFLATQAQELDMGYESSIRKMTEEEWQAAENNLKPKYTPGKGVSFYLANEVSDEEIEKAVNEYAEVYQCPTEVKMCKHDVISAWNNAIKWLKSRQ
tara:strand:+ start:1515 stop:2072 length:558 start_codon:yes stop_codon:yes gene_type:complete